MGKSLFTENDKKMITPTGDIYRYIGSDIIDSFDVGDCADISFPNGYNKGNRVFKGICPCINTTTVSRFIVKEVVSEMSKIKIRKLTPSECYKLMGFTAEDCKKVSDGGISNTQLYKQAGNSIVVNVLEAIFKSLGERYEEFRSVS